MQYKNGVPPSVSGPAGANFEAKVGASFVLAMLADAPPRGLTGTSITSIAFQQADLGNPLDDVTVHATDRDGKKATLEVQAKRSITFAPSDKVFKKVMAQICETIQQDGFWESNRVLAIATASNSNNIASYQELLSWVLNTDTHEKFFTRLNLVEAANQQMRQFVETIRTQLNDKNITKDDETVWKLLRRFKILTYDFISTSSNEIYWAIERAKGLLTDSEVSKAEALWSSIIQLTIEASSVGGAKCRQSVVNELTSKGFSLSPTRKNREAFKNLIEQTSAAIQDIATDIGSISISRRTYIEQIYGQSSEHRYLKLYGSGGVGKSALMKQYIASFSSLSQTIFLTNTRAPDGGWITWKHILGFNGTAEEFLCELAASGSAILCFDNLDFYTETKRLIVTDLLRASANVEGIKVMLTARSFENVDWLPDDIIQNSQSIEVGGLSDDEVGELKQANDTLLDVLGNNHPAKIMARNLYFLSQLARLPSAKSSTKTEVQLLKLWWEIGGGITNSDSEKREQLRILKEMGEHYLGSRDFFDSSNYDVDAISRLKNCLSVSEIETDRLTFAHDILQGWAIANIIFRYPDTLSKIDYQTQGSPSLLRAIELYAQSLLENDRLDDWKKLLNKLKASNVHPSWFQVSLTSVVHSEIASDLLVKASSVLLDDNAKYGKELLRLTKAIDTSTGDVAFPAEDENRSKALSHFSFPKNQACAYITEWLLSLDDLPITLIPEAIEVMSIFLGTLSIYKHNFPELRIETVSAPILCKFHLWLDQCDAKPYPHKAFNGEISEVEVSGIRDSCEQWVRAFAKYTPELSKIYLQRLNKPEKSIINAIKFSGSLAEVAPQELTELLRNTFKPKMREDSNFGSRDRYGESLHEHKFSPASPAQGPFFALLKFAKKEGLMLVRDIVGYAIDVAYQGKTNDQDFILVDFGNSQKKFLYKESYMWSRNFPSDVAASALMALEAWGHDRIQQGDDLRGIIDDILGDENLPAAHLLVAVDLLLSQDEISVETLVPFLSCPELVCLDRQRQNFEGTYHNLNLSSHNEPKGEFSINDLREMNSRTCSLESRIAKFALNAADEYRNELKIRLRKASQRHGEPEIGDDFSNPAFMAMHLLACADLNNYVDRTVKAEDGKEFSAKCYQPPEDIAKFYRELDLRAAEHSTSFNKTYFKFNVSEVLEDVSEVSDELVHQAVALVSDEVDDVYRHFPTQVATLVLCSNDSELLDQYGKWALTHLMDVIQKRHSSVYDVSDKLLSSNEPSMAFLGLSHNVKNLSDHCALACLFECIIYQGKNTYLGLKQAIPYLQEIDPRICKSVIRLIIKACVFPARSYDYDDTNASANKCIKEYLQVAAEEEKSWLFDSKIEPKWLNISFSNFYINDYEVIFNELVAAKTINNFIDLENSYKFEWLFELSQSLWPVTKSIKGHECDSFEWDEAYYKLLAVIMPKVSLIEAEELIVERILQFSEKAFYDSIFHFLFRLDILYFDDEEISCKKAVKVREMIISQMIETNGMKRLVGDTRNIAEMDFSWALQKIFFNDKKCYIPPDKIDMAIPFVPLLERCIKNGISLIIARLTFDFIEVKFRNEQIPLIVTLIQACSERKICSSEFWISGKIGERLCSYLRKALEVLTNDEDIIQLYNDVEAVLNLLVSLGLSRARDLNEDFLSRLR